MIRDKPAFWVDGNIHAPELAGSSACLYFIHQLLNGYGLDADITRCLDSRVFYICPRVNPDGAEYALADTPRLIRSGTRPYPYEEAPVQGLVREDIDGDGRLLSMRIRDPDGPWKVSSDDARLMVPREPAETGGEYYRLLPEGRIEHYDGALISGYPAASAYHEFRYHPNEIITGAFDDWLYDQQGVFAWTVEIWSPQREAGIGEYRDIDWDRDHPITDDLKLLKWNDEVLDGAGFVPWYPYEHPQLGRIELGGWNPLFTFWNPPPALLEKEIARFPRWLVWHALLSPQLEWHEVSATSVGEDVYLIRAVVRNSGWLPSYVTKLAQEKKRVRGVICEVELPDDVELVQGERRVDLGQLEGRAHKPASSFGWAGSVSDPTSHRAKAEWLVRAHSGTNIQITARHPRAGAVRAELT